MNTFIFQKCFCTLYNNTKLCWYVSFTYFLWSSWDLRYAWNKTLGSLKLVLCKLYSDVRCVQGLHLWRNSSSEINDELYKGYRKGNPERQINEIVAGPSNILQHYAIFSPFLCKLQVLCYFILQPTILLIQMRIYSMLQYGTILRTRMTQAISLLLWRGCLVQ